MGHSAQGFVITMGEQKVIHALNEFRAPPPPQRVSLLFKESRPGLQWTVLIIQRLYCSALQYSVLVGCCYSCADLLAPVDGSISYSSRLAHCYRNMIWFFLFLPPPYTYLPPSLPPSPHSRPRPLQWSAQSLSHSAMPTLHSKEVCSHTRWVGGATSNSFVA